jgi:hypothetical protein
LIQRLQIGLEPFLPLTSLPRPFVRCRLPSGCGRRRLGAVTLAQLIDRSPLTGAGSPSGVRGVVGPDPTALPNALRGRVCDSFGALEVRDLPGLGWRPEEAGSQHIAGLHLFVGRIDEYPAGTALAMVGDHAVLISARQTCDPYLPPRRDRRSTDDSDSWGSAGAGTGIRPAAATWWRHHGLSERLLPADVVQVVGGRALGNPLPRRGIGVGGDPWRAPGAPTLRANAVPIVGDQQY